MDGARLRGTRRGSGGVGCLPGLLAVLLLSASGAAAQTAPASDAPTGPGSDGPLVPVERAPGDDAPRVGLDDLLRLPSGYGAEARPRGGANEAEWRARFEAARQDIEAAREKLAELDAELDKTSQSSSSWQVSAPGSSDPQASPLSLRLRQDIKAERARIAEAERRLRSLHVEADLAAVPAAWRESPPE